MRDPRDTQPIPITHPMLRDELTKVRHALLGIGALVIITTLIIVWCLQ